MKISLCSAFIADNLGDAAFLEAGINIFKSFDKNINLTVVCNEPLKVAKRFDVKAVRFLSYSSVKAVIGSEVIVFGPGGVIEDATGISVFSGNIPNIFWTSLLARLFRKKIIFYAVGAGPIASKCGRIMARAMLNMADLVMVRDHGSESYLIASLGVKNKRIYEISDAAAALDFKDRRRDKILSSRMKIGVSLRPWPRWDMSGDRGKVDELRKSLDFLITAYDADIVFLPFHYGYDYPVIKKIYEGMSFKDRAVITGEFKNVNDGLEIISTLDFLVGMRLHSLIFGGVIAGKPLIALEYDAKIRYFMASIGMENMSISMENFSFTLFKSAAGDLISNIKDISGKLECIRLELRGKAETGRRLLMECLKKK